MPDLIIGTTGVGVPGSRMRHGGEITDPDSGITIAADKWVKVRCAFCRTEMMTPDGMIPPWGQPPHDSDGAILVHCGTCRHDISQGHRPGYNRHRRRRVAHRV